MSLQRNIKTRFHVFEEEFANSILNAMELTEKNSSNDFENLRIWTNLVNHLVNSNQIIHLPALMHQLSSSVCLKLRKKKQYLEKFRNSFST